MRYLVAALGVVAHLAAATAQPAPPDAPPDAPPAPAGPGPDENAAQIHLDRGVTAFDAHAFADAHHEFSEASRLAPDRPNPYRWLALTEVQLADCPAALGHIAEFVARVPADDARLAEMYRLRALCNRAGGPEAEPAPPPTPITRRWWFWAAIGGVAVGAAVTAFVLTRSEGADELPPIHCSAGGCAP